MKNKLNIFVLSAIILAFMACEKKYDWVGEQELVNGSKSYIKFVHASPSFRIIHGAQDTFNINVNGKKINSAALTYNGMWPFSVNATTNSITATYAAVEPGPNTIRLVVPGVNYRDSTVIFEMTKELAAGGKYTFLLTDSVKMDRDSSKIFVRDPDDEISTLPNFISIRFIHAVLNDTAGTTVNISSYARNANLITNVKPGTTTVYSRITLPGTVDTFYVRRYAVGAPANTGLILAKIPFNSAIAGGGANERRSYTLYYKGDANLASGTKGRSLSTYINY
jgi:hypothetical protein